MEPGTRKLVAIMFSDIAGYTALMGEDEERAVRALERSRSVVKSQVEKHGGRLLEEIGDGPSDPTYPQYLQALDDFLAEDPELAERY